ncbi:MAG TPA: rhodanese-like domain-containing protein [Crenotrichaceae bacterium]|nr:rhodanese-like domain-containing protein [Crenotrichaceae bacterium]
MNKTSHSLILMFFLAITALSCAADSGKSTIKQIDTDQLIELQKQGAIIVDVRTPGEWEQTGVIPGAKKAMIFNQQMQPVGDDVFLKQIKEITGNTDKPVVVYCRSGGRSTKAAQLLANKSFRSTIYNLDGGIQQWLAEGKSTEKP